MKFGMCNYTSKKVKPHDLSRTARTLLGNGVKENMLLPNYVSFPDAAMIRFAQERGLMTHLKLVKVVKPVVVCQGVVRQATALQGSPRQAVTASVPNRDLVSQRKEDWKKKELVQLAKMQKEEQKTATEPTTLVGAVKALNKLNDGRTGAQQRLRPRGAPTLDRSDSSVEFIAEVKGDPEKERGEKPVVRSTPHEMDAVATPPVAAPRQAAALQSAVVQAAGASVDVLDEDGDSDDPDKDRIIMQRLKVKLEIERLAKYEAEYVLKRESRRRKR